MKKCKCVKIYTNLKFVVGNIYDYVVLDSGFIHIIENKIRSYSCNKETFDIFFIDIQELRKQKLKNILYN